MKKRQSNTSQLLSKPIKNKEHKISLTTEIIGEILINRSLTIEQINDGFNIDNASKIIDDLLNSDFLEQVPEINPKAYRIKRDIEKWSAKFTII